MINNNVEVLLSIDRVYKKIFSYLSQPPSKKINIAEYSIKGIISITWNYFTLILDKTENNRLKGAV